MASRLKETQFLDGFRIGLQFMERCERRKRQGSYGEFHDKMLAFHMAEMKEIRRVVDHVEPRQYAEVLRYKYIDLLDYDEIARRTGSTPAAVQRKLYNAVKKINLEEVADYEELKRQAYNYQQNKRDNRA